MSNSSGENPQPISSSVLELARQYVQGGYSVVPVRHGEKRPAIEWKEFQSRIATERELIDWFGTNQLGLGIVCGRVSGNLICLDFDSDQAFDHFVTEPIHQALVNDAAVANSARGKHVFFRSPASVPSAAIFLEGFDGKAGDLLAEGKFVVVPPTLHPEGDHRKWQRPLDAKVPTIWADTIKLKQPPKVEKVRLSLDSIEEGERHNTLVKYGAKLRSAGNDFNSIVQALNLVNQQTCRPPLPAHEVTGIAMYLAAKSVSASSHPLPGGKWDDAIGRESIIPSSTSLREEGQEEDPRDLLFLRGKKYLQGREADALEWLIPDFLPLTYLNVLGADSKAGKTCFVTHMAHALTHGTTFLGQQAVHCPVLWVASEESEGERALVLNKYPDISDDLLISHEKIKIDTLKGIDYLHYWIQKVGAKVIVIDTLYAAIDLKSLSQGMEGRSALAPLKELCRAENVSAMVLHHINKNDNIGMTRNRFSDSGQVLAVASSDWLMGSHARKDGVHELRVTTQGRGIFKDRRMLIHSRSITEYELVADGKGDEVFSDSRSNEIVMALRSQPEGMIAQEIADAVGAKWKSVQNRLTQLVKEGLIDVVGKRGQASVYAVPQSELLEAC